MILPGTLGSFWLKICFTVSPSPVEAAWPGGSAARASPAATTRPVSAFAARRAGKECMAGSPSVIIEAAELIRVERHELPDPRWKSNDATIRVATSRFCLAAVRSFELGTAGYEPSTCRDGPQ